jgi:gliding motility-associated-like protein
MKSIFLFILIALYQTALAQHASVIPLYNPSFEGPQGIDVCPPEWEKLAGTPDVLPNDPTSAEYDQHIRATDQDNFLRLAYSITDPSFSASIGQTLRFPLVAGIPYYVTFDLAILSYPSNIKGTFALAGGSDVNDPGEVLWLSGAIYHPGWKKFTALFTPTRTINYLRIYSYNPGLSNTEGGVLIDNFSPIYETLNLMVTTNRTCIGETTGSVAVMVPGPESNYTINWQPGAYTTPVVDHLASGTYEVTVLQIADGVSASIKIEVGVSDPRITTRVKQVSCYDKTDALIQVTAARGLFPYQYFLNDEQNTSGLFNNIAPGNYTIKVIDSIGCTVQEDTVIIAPEKFWLDKMIVKNIPCSDLSNGQITLFPSGGTPPYTYSIPGYEPQPDSIFSQLPPGTYDYLITDSHNCTIDSSATISKTWNTCAVHVPNAFSPNGDGVNDLFRVKLQDDVSDYRMTVYGRWGQLVYDTRQPEAGWDGTFKGKKLPPGTYVWAVTYTDSKDQLMKQQGSVVLIN